MDNERGPALVCENLGWDISPRGCEDSLIALDSVYRKRIALITAFQGLSEENQLEKLKTMSPITIVHYLRLNVISEENVLTSFVNSSPEQQFSMLNYLTGMDQLKKLKGKLNKKLTSKNI